MGDKKWAVAANQPDWMDVEAAIRAIDAMHSVTTMVTISTLGIGSTGGLRVTITSHWDKVDGKQEEDMLHSERVWIGHLDKELPGFILGGIYHHDFMIGEKHQQRILNL